MSNEESRTESRDHQHPKTKHRGRGWEETLEGRWEESGDNGVKEKQEKIVVYKGGNDQKSQILQNCPVK